MHNSIQTKEKIISIATRLFEEHGFDKVSIKQICSELGLGRSAFYYHFKTKEDILQAYYNCNNVFRPEVLSWVLSGSTDVEKALRVQLASLRYFTSIHVESISRLIGHGLKKGFKDSIVDDHMLRTLLKPLIDSGKEKKEIKNTHPTAELIDTAISIQIGILMRYVIEEGALDVEKELRTQLDVLYQV